MSEIDNKTKAAVLREFADNMSEPGVDRSVYELARSEANKLDPPEKPIHPHDGCTELFATECIFCAERRAELEDMDRQIDLRFKAEKELRDSREENRRLRAELDQEKSNYNYAVKQANRLKSELVECSK